MCLGELARHMPAHSPVFYSFILMSLQSSRTFTYAQIWAIAYPILISTLMEQLIGMTDTAFLGRVGEIELGASALGGIFYITIFMLGLGFSIGAQILMGRRNGEGNYDRIGTIFYHSLAFLLLMAVILFALTRCYAPQMLERIIRSHNVYVAANDYLHWRVFGFFFAFVNVMFRAFYVATTHTRTLTLNSVVMVLSNVCFNYVLIFGKFGVPAFGIAGAAMGSCMAEAVSTLFFIVHTHRNIPYARYGLNRLPRFRFALLGKLLGVSVWTMVQNFLSLATWFIFFLSVEHLGERQLAATNIVRNISSFTFMTVIALASTASTLASNLMGQRDYQAVWPMMRRTVALGFAILLPAIALISLFPEAVMGVFTNDAELIQAAKGALFVLLSSYLFTIPAQILFHVVSGTGNTRTALALEFSALFLYCIYIGVVIFSLRASLPWCWASEHVYAAFMLLFSFVYLKKGNWQKKEI